MYEEYKVYGPYKRNDGRMHVCLVHNENKSRKTVSYPRYRIECILGRILNENEEVHHKDNDETNNSDDNFQIVNGTAHKSHHGKLNLKYIPEEWTCYYCEKKWWATTRQISQRLSKQKQGKALVGPFCSRSCQGKVCN